MKKILMLMLVVMLVFTACGKKNDKKAVEETNTPQVTEQKQEETKTDNNEVKNEETPAAEEEKSEDAVDATNDVADETQPEAEPTEEVQGEAVQIDGEEFENLLGDYESAKNSGDAEAERAALDEIQKILEKVQ